jgi:death-on-curing protein
MSDLIFLTIEQVEILHRLALEQHGGQDGVRDMAAFQSAVMHPQNVWFYGQGDLFEVAAAYAFHIAESQAFIDGNKRTGIAAALTFLRLNDQSVMQHTDELHQAMIAVAEHQMDKTALAVLFRRLAN